MIYDIVNTIYIYFFVFLTALHWSRQIQKTEKIRNRFLLTMGTYNGYLQWVLTMGTYNGYLQWVLTMGTYNGYLQCTITNIKLELFLRKTILNCFSETFPSVHIKCILYPPGFKTF